MPGRTVKDKASWKTEWELYKFSDPDGSIERMLKAGADPNTLIAKSKEPFKENLALNEGITELVNLLIGSGSPTNFNNTNAYIGVGNSNTAAQAVDTGLLGASKSYVVMDSGYPTLSNQTVIWRATYGTSTANYAWEEYTVANGNSDSAINLNRKVESKGTKVAGETWTLQVRITFS